MQDGWNISGAGRLVAPLILIFAVSISALSQPSPPALKTAPNASVATEKELGATQEQLLKLLRISPTLTEVVARDPSLLSNAEYVSRSNPQLGQFLQAHPEIARNPDFYLFSGLREDGRPPDQALERKVWPELSQPTQRRSLMEIFMDGAGPFLVFVCVLGALLWLIQVFLENRRWGRLFKAQIETHGKLIERFGTNQELLVYMGTDAGKRFLEAAPIPVSFEPEQRIPNAVARVLTPLQIGVVLTLLGIGLLFLRHSLAEFTAPFLVLGVVVLMPGLGFIVSAGITWVLAGRLGLMPENTTAPRGSDTSISSRN